jgi:hypothetical protein
MFGASTNRATYQYSSWDEGRPRLRWGALLGCFALLAIAGALAWVVSRQRGALADSRAQLEQAVTEAARAKADLGKITAVAADLQLQLDKTKAERTGQANASARLQALQVELAQAQSDRADLQGKLERTQADLHAQQAQVADLEARAPPANDGSPELRRQLDQANVEKADLKAQVAQAQSAVLPVPAPAPPLRPLPITSSFKKALWRHRFTLRVKNSGPDPLQVTVKIAGEAGASVRSSLIASGKTLELEKLRSGSQVVIASAGYASVDLTVP